MDDLRSRALLVALRMLGRLAAPGRGRPGGDRGDVPGWVLVTLMSAALVSALWVVAEPALTGMFSAALDSVTGP